MAKQIVVVVPHAIGAHQATDVIRDQMPHIQGALGKFAKLQDVKWEGNAATYAVVALGVTAPGAMSVFEDRVEISADLPAVLAPFAPMVEDTIRKRATEIFTRRAENIAERGPREAPTRRKRDAEDQPTDARRQIGQLARAAAKEAGLAWRQMSDEDRRRYRKDARRQLRSGT